MRLLLCAAFGVLALAGYGIQAQSHTLRVKGKVGDTYKYSLSSVIASVGAKGEIRFTATLTERLSKIAGTEFHWQTDFSNVKASASGVMAGADETFRSMDGLSMTSIQDNRGQVLRLKMGSQEIASRGSANVVLPPGPVKVGGRWDATIETAGLLLTIRYELIGLKTYAGRSAAVIRGSFPSGSAAKAIEPTEFLVDVATGRMLKGSALTEVKIQGKVMRVRYQLARA